MITEDVLRRQTGELPGRALAGSVAYRRRLGLELSSRRSVQSVHQGAVTWLDLDHVEQRYLLAGAADASIAVYDTQQACAPANDTGGVGGGGSSSGGAGESLGAVLHITKQTPGAHRFSVSAVAWYPVDTGLFVSGGYDNEVKVWDANTLAVAAGFSLSSRVHAVAMSPAATAHCLVAVGSGEPQVMLCDITSGGFTHTLSGHRGAVWAIHWSLQSEWQLMTGGCDGQLRLWDIRRSGPLRIFDQHQTQEAHRAARQAQQAQQGQEGQQARSSGGNGNRGAYGKRRRSDHDAGPSQRGSVLNGHGAGSGGGSNSSARRVQRNGGNPTTSSSGAGPGAGPPGHRMFLPDKVTRYATAHGASITAVHPTPDGLFWLSAGTDDRVRLWDAMTYRHMLVNYPGAFNRSLRARQLSVSEDGRVLFHPSGSAVQMFEVGSGAAVRVLQGAHFDTVNCCKWNPAQEELYTGSSDCHILVWAPPASDRGPEEADELGPDSDADNWSD